MPEVQLTQPDAEEGGVPLVAHPGHELAGAIEEVHRLRIVSVGNVDLRQIPAGEGLTSQVSQFLLNDQAFF